MSGPWANEFPAYFDVGNPTAGHMHFDQNGSKWYGPDGTTVQLEYDTATGALTLTGSISHATTADNSTNLTGGGTASGDTTIAGSLIVGSPAASHVVIGSDVHGADGVRLYGSDGVTVLIDLTIAGTPTISASNIVGNTITGGTVSGTTITGTTISGNSISGGTVSGTTVTGTTISGGTISGTSISGATVTGSTVIGGTVETSSGSPRVVLDGSTNALRFYNSSGNEVGNLGPSGNSLNLSNPFGLGLAYVTLQGAGFVQTNSLTVDNGISVTTGGVAVGGSVSATDCNNLREIQSGVNTSISMGVGTGTASTTVTFPRAFASAPVVTVTIATTAGGTVMTTRVTSVTSSSFQITLDRATTTTAVSNVPVDWIAVLSN